MKLSLRIISLSITSLARCLHHGGAAHLCQEELKPDLLQPPSWCPAQQKQDLFCQTGGWECFPVVLPMEAFGFLWMNDQEEVEILPDTGILKVHSK